MEEVDNIIIHTLKQIGCDLDGEVLSLRQFTTELVVAGVVKCLQLIKPDLELPKHVPPSMAARYRLGATLASACTAVGYSGEIGYETFLYSSETELRKIFVFLIEKLPKDTEKITDEPLGSSALIVRSVVNELSICSSLPWLPWYCKERGLRWSSTIRWHREGCRGNKCLHTCPLEIPNYTSSLGSHLGKTAKSYFENQLKCVTEQVSSGHILLPSLMEYNAADVAVANEWDTEWSQSGLESCLSEQDYRQRKRARLQKRIGDIMRQAIQNVPATEIPNRVTVNEKATVRIKSSRFMHTEKLQFTQEEELRPKLEEVRQEQSNSEDLARKHEEELRLLQEEIEDVTDKFGKLNLQSKQLSAGITQMLEQLSGQEQKDKELKELYAVKKQTFDLLPDAENNLVKLQEVVEATGQRLVSLASQWEKHRAPLVEQYRQLKELNSQQLDESQRKLEEIKLLREKMKEIAQEARNKEDLYKQLVGELEKLTKDVNRSSYTRRIIEIVGNIKKQKAEIEKVLLDTKSVQKEINTLSGKLDRTFTVTDELIFKDAKKDEASRRAYKHLAALHENCSQLIQTVEETGAIMREIRDLEDQIEIESQKKVAANLERITADLKQMKQENLTLVSQLKRS